MIHPTAIISSKASLGKNVKIGPFTIIYDDVFIGDNTQIDGYCEIGYPTPLAKTSKLTIAVNSIIRSHTIFYQGSAFGEALRTGHHVTVRENTIAGDHFQIGSYGDIQGDCELGERVRCHSSVHIAKGSKLGDYIWLYPFVVLTNDPHPPSDVQDAPIIEDYAVIATKSTLLPGVRVGTHALVGAHSRVDKDVKPHMLVHGVPAKEICETKYITLQDGSGRSAYPWNEHFSPR